MANVYPPSPALSAVDSLADIKDLDAFLDAQGALSHWPTPPSADEKDKIVASAFEYDSDDSDEADDELWRIAVALTDLTSVELGVKECDYELVVDILARAAVAPAVLALAFNILSTVTACAKQQLNDSCFSSPDLTVVACLSLSTTFIYDKDAREDYWASHVCRGTWTARRIDSAVLDFLMVPEVNMLLLSEEPAINAALRTLCDIARVTVLERDDKDDGEPEDHEEVGKVEPPPSLKLETANTSAKWAYGVLTPAETPQGERVSFFLPLL